MKTVIKRDKELENFDATKIKRAITKANNAVKEEDRISEEQIDEIVEVILFDLGEKEKIDIEEIQDFVEKELTTVSYPIAKAYILKREERARARENTIDKTINEIVGGKSKYWTDENSNKNATLLTTQRDNMAGAVSTDAVLRYLLDKDIIKAHEQGILHFHDADYFLQKMNNCGLINLEDCLQNGTVISGSKIDKPHEFSTACNVATQIIAQVASFQYGGQSFSLAHLSPFVEETRKSLKLHFPDFTDEQIERLVNRDIEKGVQTLQYQIVTLMTTNGQAPFCTLYINLAEVPEGKEREDLAKVAEEVLKQRIKGIKNEQGVYITVAFPKIIYALDEFNEPSNKDSKYWYLTELAAKCTAKRMVPDYVSNKIQRKMKNGDVFPFMGCRSGLTVDRTTENYANALNYEKYKNHKYYGRFNQGVVTINLIDVAMSSKKNEEVFWKIFDERLELCHKALRRRHERLLGTKSDVAPILWQNGVYARLNKGETIDKLLFNGYSTISLGYAGLYECIKYMTGESHTSEIGKPLAIKVMKYMNNKCEQWKKEENIDYSLYGTPLESTTYKFAKCLKKRFGKEWKELSGKDYITNSYHVNVQEKIDAFTKLSFESEFQELSPGGAISYVEVPNMENNIPAVLQIMEHIYQNILYAELNCKSDFCQKCQYTGEIKVKGKPGEMYWECPNCGNKDKTMLNIARRTCGYIGSNFWNQGRTQEISERVLHVDQ